jgi:hypothetical protein
MPTILELANLDNPPSATSVINQNFDTLNDAVDALEEDLAVIDQAVGTQVTRAFARGYRTAAVNSPNNAWGAVALDTEDYDTTSIFNIANGRFTPTVEGYYLVNMRCRTGTTGSIAVAIGKNGAEALGVGGDIAASLGSGGSGIIHCNGTTDYLELFVFTNTARAITVGSFDTWMSVYGPL